MTINNETKVGVLIAIALGLLVYLTINAGDFHVTEKGYELKVHFLNIDGITLNSPVTLNGLEVGRVKNIQLTYDQDPKIVLTLWVKDHIKIFRGVKAHVKNLGFMGEKFIGLTMTNKKLGYLSPGEIIVGTEPTNFDNLLKQGEAIAMNMKEISENINERLRVNSQAIDEVIFDMRSTMKNVNAISENLNERFTVNEHLVDDMMVHVKKASGNLEELSYDLKENPWKLLYRPKKKDK